MEEWYRGERDGVVGWFPKAYVELAEDQQPSQVPVSESTFTARYGCFDQCQECTGLVFP